MKIQYLLASTMLVALATCCQPAFAQRVFGLDTSSAANLSAPSQAQWNDAFNNGWASAGIPSFSFAFVRSSRGGSSDATRVDDSQFYDNISRGTNAGLLVGSYHFARPDAFDTHTAVDDANHYLERAGMYMKPGYLLPVFDLEAGNTQHTTASLTTWSLDFINTIAAAKGINPIVYTNSSYNNDEVTAAVAFTNIASSPHTGERTYQWLARPSGSLTTGQPVAASGFPDPYGVWDPNFTTKSASVDPVVKPWAFWQNGNASIAPSGTPGNQFLVDLNAANGNIEFVKDFLVPALWTNSGSGNWETIANWNSDNPTFDGSPQSGPLPRLPNNPNLDWVKLQNSGGGTVTLSSPQTARKFYTQQPLNITVGSLSVNYIPGSGGKWDLPSEFNAPVTLSSAAIYSAHTTQVDGGSGQFNINGGIVIFRAINLASHASTPGKIVIGGDVTFDSTTLGGTGTAVIRSTGSLAQPGFVDLGAANRALTIDDSASPIDVSIEAKIIGTGGLTKNGPGTLRLAASNTYGGNTTIQEGRLLVSNTSGSGTGTGSVTMDSGTILGGTGVITGSVILNGATIAPGESVGAVSAGNVAFNPASAFDYEYNSNLLTADVLNIGNALNIGSSVSLHFANLAGGLVPQNSKITLISYAGSWNGGLFNGFANNSTFNLGGNDFRLKYDDTPSGSLNGGAFSHAVTLTALNGPPRTTIDGFVDVYAPENWTTGGSARRGSTVDTSGAPGSITIIGPDDGSGAFGEITYLIHAASNGTFSFDWLYTSTDVPGYDFAYYVNNTPILLSNSNGQSGHVSVTINAGDTIGWRVTSTDSIFGAGVLQITNFSAPAPAPVPEPASWLFAVAAGVFFIVPPARQRFR